MTKVNVQEIQAPLRTQYRSSPQAALVTDHARTTGGDPGDPFHSVVEPMPGCGATLPVGVHRAIGGMHDAPTPGDILCAALAACQDSAVRMVANLLGVELEFLAVDVTGEVDVRGTMALEQTSACWLSVNALQCPAPREGWHKPRAFKETAGGCRALLCRATDAAHPSSCRDDF